MQSLIFVQIFVLKDYYYFLGIRRDAAEEEIRQAYRKLSMKYHPDKNGGDDFFENRFREIQEAYETLSDPERRRIYDENMGSEKSLRNHLPPYIKTFSSSKIRATKGDEIFLNWQTSNADLVKILPFGMEKAYGERSFRITEFQNGKFHVVLQATNTLINKSVVQGITISEIFGREADSPDIEPNYPIPSQENIPRQSVATGKAMLWLTIICIIIALALLIYKN